MKSDSVSACGFEELLFASHRPGHERDPLALVAQHQGTGNDQVRKLSAVAASVCAKTMAMGTTRMATTRLSRRKQSIK